MEWAIRYDPGGDWIPYMIARAEDWQDLDGHWLPRRLHKTSIDVQLDESQHVLLDATAELSNWVINADLPSDAFRFTFEPGTMVRDTLRGTVYQAGKVSDRRLEEDTQAALRLRSQFEEAQASLSSPHTGWGPRKRIVKVICGLAVLAILSTLVMVWRLRIRK
jgi:hypothetical protein